MTWGMTTPETIADAIEQTALNPRSVTVGNQSVTSQSVADQIAADRYVKSLDAASAAPAGFGIRIQRIKPPGGG